MNRRGFLQSILAAGIAPWVITKAGVLMPVCGLAVPNPGLITDFGALTDLQKRMWGQSLHRAAGGKSVFLAMQSIEMARAGKKVVVFSINPEPMKSLIEELSGPQGVPGPLIFSSYNK